MSPAAAGYDSSVNSQSLNLQLSTAWQEKAERSASSSSIESPSMLDSLKHLILPASPRTGFEHDARRQAIAPKLLRDQLDERVVTRARLYVIDWLLGSRKGQYCAVAFTGLLLHAAASLGWFAMGGSKAFPPSFKSSVWIAYAMIFDPGTQTGLWEDEKKTSSRTLSGAAVISFLGFIYMLVLLGLIVETIRTLLAYLLKSRSRIVMTGHIVILGWTDKTVYLLREMFLEAENRGTGRQQIVILSEQNVLEMRQSIADHLPKKHSHIVRCRNGCPYDANELLRVSIGSARDIIVLGQACSPRESDLEMVRVILGLAALSEPLSGRVIAEVKCADMAPVVEALLAKDDAAVGPQVEAIHARSTIHRMLCLMTVKPVIGDALAGLSSFEYGEELYCVRAPDLWGQTFQSACQFFSQGLCIGIKPEGKQVILAPNDDRLIEPTDRLLLIAADELSLDEHKIQSANLARTKSRKSVLGKVGTMALKPTKSMKRSTLLTGQSFCDDATAAHGMPPPIIANVLEQDRSGSLYVIIGWADDFKDLIMALDTYVRKGTIVHILTEKPEHERDSVKNSPGWNPINIHLIEQFGSRASVDGLLTLPLAEASAILVLAEESGTTESGIPSAHSGGNGMFSDSTTVTSAVMICGICEGKYGKERVRELRGRIICEVLDPVTDRMLRCNTELKKRVTFFRSNALETGLFAMAASEPIIFNTLVLLLSPTHDIGKLVSEPVSKYTTLPDGVVTIEHLSFWELHERIRETNGDLLIGWYRLADGRVTLGCLVDRFEPFSFAVQDRLLVIKRVRPNEVPRALTRPDAAQTADSRPQAPQAPEVGVAIPVLPSPVSCSTPPGGAPEAAESLGAARTCTPEQQTPKAMAAAEVVREPEAPTLQLQLTSPMASGSIAA